MNKLVTLAAEGIQVTARDYHQAERYLRDDAGEFRRNWDYDLIDIEDTDEEPSGDADDIEMTVELEDSAGSGERTWDGRALFSVVVSADVEDAEAEARRILAS
jgi:hypothetical protein